MWTAGKWLKSRTSQLRPAHCAPLCLGFRGPQIQLRNPGGLSPDKLACKYQLGARRAGISKSTRCAKEALFNDNSKCLIANRRVGARIVRKIRFHDLEIALPYQQQMPIAALNRNRALRNSSRNSCKGRFPLSGAERNRHLTDLIVDRASLRSPLIPAHLRSCPCADDTLCRRQLQRQLERAHLIIDAQKTLCALLGVPNFEEQEALEK